MFLARKINILLQISMESLLQYTLMPCEVHIPVVHNRSSEKGCDTALLISRPCYRCDMVGMNASPPSCSSRLRPCQCKSTAVMERKHPIELHDLSPPSFSAFYMVVRIVDSAVAKCNLRVPSLYRGEHVCGFCGTLDRYPSRMDILRFWAF